MKILMINSVCGIRSTGRICTDLARMLEEQGHECRIAYGRETVPEKFKKYAFRIGKKTGVYIHALKARLFDSAGFGSGHATKKLIKEIKAYSPDIIHLHNIHGYYLHVGKLFRFLREYNKPVLWSFYDCWSFTGHCAHFDFNECDKWMTDCRGCAFKNEYPSSMISKASKNRKKKSELFTGIPKMSLILPSLWMKTIVSKSYMKDYPTFLMPNGIDLKSFSPEQSDFKIQHNLSEKFILLGVASFWNEMKGLDYFNRLADELDSKIFKVILVGKADESALSQNIFHISATNDVRELCRIYSAADVFVNPTLQETQGLTTVEAFACGTPAIVFNSGGAAECVNDSCGIVVEKGDYAALRDSILEIQSGKRTFNRDSCLQIAAEYDSANLYKSFIELYESLT